MNVLFLAPRLPLPADTGGKIRTFNILKQVMKFAQVHLVCFSFELKDEHHAEDLRKLGCEVTLVPSEKKNIFEKAKSVLLDPLPYSISKYYCSEMERVLKLHMAAGHFDCVHVDHLHMAHYQEVFGEVPCFIDDHNVEFRILQRCAEVERSPFKKLLFASQAGKMKQFEAQKVQEYSRYFAVSADDWKLLGDISFNRVSGAVIPNGVDTEFFNSSSTVVVKDHNLVFTGSMDWLPNEDAILFLAKAILPLIWQKKPSVTITIVGKNPTPAVLNLAKKDSRLIVAGRVEDVRPLMAQAKVFVVPIRVGGGTRLKILEAMAMEKAVVSTTVGAEGIQHTNGRNIHLADLPQDFAEKVCFILDHPQEALNLGKEARQLVCAQYDWRIIGGRLKKIYEDEIRGSR